MTKISLEHAAENEPEEQLWFMSKCGDAIYRRGRDGLCIDLRHGKITSTKLYVDSVWDVFDNPEQYRPLKKGDKIVIEI